MSQNNAKNANILVIPGCEFSHSLLGWQLENK